MADHRYAQLSKFSVRLPSIIVMCRVLHVRSVFTLGWPFIGLSWCTGAQARSDSMKLLSSPSDLSFSDALIQPSLLSQVVSSLHPPASRDGF